MSGFMTVTLVVRWNPEDPYEASPLEWDWSVLADTKVRMIDGHPTNEDEIFLAGEDWLPEWNSAEEDA